MNVPPTANGGKAPDAAAKPAAQLPPALRRAIQAAAEELHDDATTMADFAINLSRDLPRGQQYALLQRLVEIGRQMHRAINRLCDASDRARDLRDLPGYPRDRAREQRQKR